MSAVQPSSEPPAEARLIRSKRLGLRPQKSVIALAKAAGISDGRWRQIENGYESKREGLRIEAVGSATTIARMARALGITGEELVTVGRADAADELVGLEASPRDATARGASASGTGTAVAGGVVTGTRVGPIETWSTDELLAEIGRRYYDLQKELRRAQEQEPQSGTGGPESSGASGAGTPIAQSNTRSSEPEVKALPSQAPTGDAVPDGGSVSDDQLLTDEQQRAQSAKARTAEHRSRSRR